MRALNARNSGAILLSWMSLLALLSIGGRTEASQILRIHFAGNQRPSRPSATQTCCRADSFRVIVIH
jgi:hypothetical protein